MTTHFMVDLETLGSNDDAVILSMAVVPFKFDDTYTFDQYVVRSFYLKLNAPEQIKKYKHTTSKDTLEWWEKQSKETRKLNLTYHETDVEYRAAFEQLWEFLSKSNYDLKNSYLWSRGSFDFHKIEYALRELNLPQLNVWKIRDTRTYIDIMAGVSDAKYQLKKDLPATFIAHHCLHDAIKEVMVVNELFTTAMKP
jgi:hypothetical protein